MSVKITKDDLKQIKLWRSNGSTKEMIMEEMPKIEGDVYDALTDEAIEDMLENYSDQHIFVPYTIKRRAKRQGVRYNG